jgi:hypothetical protein
MFFNIFKFLLNVIKANAENNLKITRCKNDGTKFQNLFCVNSRFFHLKTSKWNNWCVRKVLAYQIGGIREGEGRGRMGQKATVGPTVWPGFEFRQSCNQLKTGMFWESDLLRKCHQIFAIVSIQIIFDRFWESPVHKYYEIFPLTFSPSS